MNSRFQGYSAFLDGRRLLQQSGAVGMFIIEFFRVWDADQAHANLGRVEHDTTDLQDAKVRARSLFETLNIP